MHPLHAATLLSLGWAVAAFDPAKRYACSSRDYDFCLDSFVWCASPNDDDDNKGCSFPENTFPYYDRESGSNPALLLWSKNYTITWKKTDDKYPVQLRWGFSVQRDPQKSGSWSKNITKGAKSFSFTFEDLAAEIGNSSDTNFTVAEVKGFAADLTNSFQISQPEKYAAQGEENRFDHSDQFTVLDDIASRYLKTQEQISHRQTYHKWKLGVGIGVGVGVPILMIVSMVMGWCLGKRGRAKRTPKTVSPRASME
ncbi:hypothetical protein VFPFJ_04580 [Purpureocillium lilacinum]|uniref:Uncharacterized protein n=1 Tax=Purpureocillium lilacinum TaxID=33203 RepID=A0A179HLS6_PURLI|nr:hypothetical protein VFPFJ_04580 [Purpureocillium lilacinum]OAQ90420.1 hypothetical protein VFPFJ_04580 [Purpureocillium lilacinum]GJN67996.1 hypothetical protein PLICBS_002038 [Purpureocillium lilacinum]